MTQTIPTERECYEAGYWSASLPPVDTNNWEDRDWILWIQRHGCFHPLLVMADRSSERAKEAIRLGDKIGEEYWRARSDRLRRRQNGDPPLDAANLKKMRELRRIFFWSRILYENPNWLRAQEE